MLVTQGGNKKIEVSLANAQAITDTTTRYYNAGAWSTGSAAPIPNWNDYNRHVLLVINSHDQAITVGLMTNVRGSYDTLSVGVAKTAQSFSAAANGPFNPFVISDTDMVSLKGILSGEVSMNIKSATAPLSGSITIKLLMWSE